MTSIPARNVPIVANQHAGYWRREDSQSDRQGRFRVLGPFDARTHASCSGGSIGHAPFDHFVQRVEVAGDRLNPRIGHAPVLQAAEHGFVHA